MAASALANIRSSLRGVSGTIDGYSLQHQVRHLKAADSPCRTYGPTMPSHRLATDQPAPLAGGTRPMGSAGRMRSRTLFLVSERDEPSGHVFISYVRENSSAVDELQQAFESAGIRVWRDTRDLWPGEDWREKIRDAITRNALVFIACFSRESSSRAKSYQNEELTLAVEEIRQRPPKIPWLIPVRLDNCDIPDLDIGGGRRLVQFSTPICSALMLRATLAGLLQWCFGCSDSTRFQSGQSNGMHRRMAPNLSRLQFFNSHLQTLA